MEHRCVAPPIRSRLNLQPAVSLTVEKRTGANIIAVVDTVKGATTGVISLDGPVTALALRPDGAARREPSGSP